jgi:hypothetical protein
MLVVFLNCILRPAALRWLELRKLSTFGLAES